MNIFTYKTPAANVSLAIQRDGHAQLCVSVDSTSHRIIYVEDFTCYCEDLTRLVERWQRLLDLGGFPNAAKVQLDTVEMQSLAFRSGTVTTRVQRDLDGSTFIVEVGYRPDVGSSTNAVATNSLGRLSFALEFPIARNQLAAALESIKEIMATGTVGKWP